MAVKELMQWIGSQKRWRKRYRGGRYYVSPRQLGCPATKEASRAAANTWWEAKQAELDEELAQVPNHPQHILNQYDYALKAHSRYARWQRRFGSVEEAAKSERVMEILAEMLRSPDPEFPLPKYYEDPLNPLRRDLDPDERPGFDIYWRDRYVTLRKLESAEAEDSVSEDSTEAHIQKYLELEKARHVARGKISAYYNRKQWLECFRQWAIANAPKLEQITEKAWEGFFLHLAGRVEKGDFTGTTAANYQAAARWFIVQRWESKNLEQLPRNLNSRRYSFAKTKKDPVVFSKEEVSLYLKSATERQKLYLLLMLNCGMYPSDIGQLLQKEVDWKQGRIRRKRTKTRDRSDNVPLVDYPLWDETFCLLKKFRTPTSSKHPHLALTNTNDSPLWREESKTGKDGKETFWRDDNIKLAYRELQKDKLKLKSGDPKKKPIKSLRKTGATMLGQSQYGRFSEHYLGEAPSTTATKHYIHQNGSEFDEAILWLGRELGLQ